jgi:hypothetical protein
MAKRQTDSRDEAVGIAGDALVVDVLAPSVADIGPPDALIIGDVALPPDDADVFVLSSEDLAPDTNNEVVVSALDGMSITLMADEDIARSGVAGDHVTAAGIDVAGLEYVSFTSGLTVYYQPDAVKVRR